MSLSNKHRIAILGTRFGQPDIERAELSTLGVEFVLGAATSAEDLVDVAEGATAILAGSPPMFGREVLAQLPACRAIVRYGVGIETIDLEAATERGIIVANVPDYCTEEVATHTVALILACARKLLPAHKAATGGQWQVTAVRPLFSTEDQAVGIIGFGKIGQAVARKLRPFGFEILVYDPYIDDETLAEHSAKAVTSSELFTRSDIISLNAPLNDDTYHLVDEQTLDQMKPTAFIVNTSRGGLIDEEALARALDQDKIAGAALDVMEREPVPRDHALLNSDRILVTPHVAWYTLQSTERMRRLASREVARVLRGEWPWLEPVS
jgi:D-3-phosphoglycerate dehydrogenase